MGNLNEGYFNRTYFKLIYFVIIFLEQVSKVGNQFLCLAEAYISSGGLFSP